MQTSVFARDSVALDSVPENKNREPSMLKLFILAAFALISLSSTALADALHLNPSQLASARNMQEFGPTSMPIGYYEYCQRYRSQCERPAGNDMIELTEERWQAMLKANWIANNTVTPKTDDEIFGVEERWEYPKTAGDCEDYVLIKRKILADQGFPLGSLRITVGLDADGGGHAVLTVVTNLGDFVLDNVEQEIKSWDQTEIQYLKWQSGSDPNVWISLVDPVVAASMEPSDRSTARPR
jgi:predicted transglutaminase-like cysteine proteinase